MAEQFSIPTVGDLIAGKYRVESELGRGAYGVVFRADQEELGRHVAVKTLLPQAFLQQDIVQRFHREAQLISRLDHPNIIRLFDYGMDEGLLYMAVEYVEGRTLMDVIDNDAPIPPERARTISLQILDALVHAHAQGIVHRDLKPENIVLLQTRTTDGREYEVVKILDFGISKLLRGEDENGALKSLTQDGTVLGTPHYMSPENIVGDPIDHRADLYAFGVILYELLIGQHPFDAPSPSAVMVRHLRDDVPELPDEIRETPFGVAIDRSLEKQPWDRIGSAAELIEILEAADVSEIPVVTKRPSQEVRGSMLGPGPDEKTTVRPPEEERRNDGGPWFIVAIIAIALLVAGIGWTLFSGGDETDPVVVTQPDVVPPIVDSKEPEPALTPDVGIALAEPDDDVGTGAAMVFPADPDPEPEVEPEPEPAVEVETPKPRPRPEPAPTSVSLKVTSVPTNANVVIDGVPVGATPLERTFALKQPVEVRFTHIGYKEKTVRFTPQSDSGPIRANLEKDHLRLIE